MVVQSHAYLTNAKSLGYLLAVLCGFTKLYTQNILRDAPGYNMILIVSRVCLEIHVRYIYILRALHIDLSNYVKGEENDFTLISSVVLYGL